MSQFNNRFNIKHTQKKEELFRHHSHINKEKPQDFRTLFLQLFRYISKSSVLLFFIIFMVIILTGFTVFRPIILGSIIDSLAIFDDQSVDFDTLYHLLALLIFLTILASLFLFAQNYLSARFTKNTILHLRKDVFHAISSLPIAYMDGHNHGDMMSRLNNDTDNIANVLSQSVGSFISSIISVIALTVIMLYYSPLLTLVIYVFVPLSLIISKKISKVVRAYYRKKYNYLGILEENITDNIQGYETLLAYDQRHKAREDFEKNNNYYTDYSIKAGILSSLVHPLMILSSSLAYLIVVFTGGYLAINGSITVGVIQIFLLYVRQITMPLNNLSGLYTQIQTALAGAERIFALLNEAKERSAQNKKKSQITTLKGDISFKNLSFSYPQGEDKKSEKYILKDFNLHIRAGQKIAIVGETGSGKTSLINLLMEFYTIHSGKIEFDGVDMSNYSLQEIREQIALVSQEPFLFSESIAYNLSYSQFSERLREEFNALTDDQKHEKIVNAAKSANAHNFIMQLPNKYETLLTSEGKNLSIGQKQLLALARTFMLDAPILILDEATANVDTLTEMQIQEAIFKLMEDKTCIVIAHRLSTIIRMDTIFVLDKGKIVEWGKHEELLERKGVYYRLYTHS